jgi:DNA repair photolyase
MTKHLLFEEPTRAPSFPSRRDDGVSTFVPLSELSPGPGSGLKGIARIAAAAEEIDQRNDVEYLDLPCKTLLSPCESRRVPFDYTINPYRGCEFGCVYCFARYTHEYMELQEWEAFERRIFVKRGAPEALLRDFRKRDLRGKWIAIGAATDPYQPAERREGVTRSILTLLARRKGLQLSITTKSDLVVRDLDLLQEIAKNSHVHVNVTITTPHYELSRKTEPRAPRPDKRLDAVRQLNEGGVAAGVFLMPLLPQINDASEDLDLFVRLVKESGAAYLASNVLYLRKCSRKRFMPFIEERFPELLPTYKRLYSSRGAKELSEYSKRKQGEVRALKAKHGVPSWPHRFDVDALPDDQLSLLDL